MSAATNYTHLPRCRGLELLDGVLYGEPITEMLNGVVYYMAPMTTNHNIVIRNVMRVFDRFFEGKKCEYFVDGHDVHFSDKETVVPDVLVVCDNSIVKEMGIYGAPDLVVEVLSKSTAKRDKGYKFRLYEQHGVKEYWIADPDGKTIDIYSLINGRFELFDALTFVPENKRGGLSEMEKLELKYEFNSPLFPEMRVKLDVLFSNLYEF